MNRLLHQPCFPQPVVDREECFSLLLVKFPGSYKFI